MAKTSEFSNSYRYTELRKHRAKPAENYIEKEDVVGAPALEETRVTVKPHSIRAIMV